METQWIVVGEEGTCGGGGAVRRRTCGERGVVVVVDERGDEMRREKGLRPVFWGRKQDQNLERTHES
ncbi:hypothetical protein E3N88_30355 [Mikania micrantha]|uniref:Uncharacterized protein n=1 Tax=Mikania micrantha TaxID=192012 RepID=A0A5N6MLD0_9ASTR|nr:hypothetical protein E3N88_30355 [Mikania micrantha]